MGMNVGASGSATDWCSSAVNRRFWCMPVRRRSFQRPASSCLSTTGEVAGSVHRVEAWKRLRNIRRLRRLFRRWVRRIRTYRVQMSRLVMAATAMRTTAARCIVGSLATALNTSTSGGFQSSRENHFPLRCRADSLAAYVPRRGADRHAPDPRVRAFVFRNPLPAHQELCEGVLSDALRPPPDLWRNEDEIRP